MTIIKNEIIGTIIITIKIEVERDAIFFFKVIIVEFEIL